ncbi:GPW/gp25 family protein [Sorangium sp. So ce406]|uniref:GPW/gp25 family protein n=1 Tax=Sorangium sp. So ce406 TaxID=3133311 RepID=UPI003F5B6FF4
MANRARYGTGFAFPLAPGPGFSWISGEDAVAQALRTLLLTEPGERIGRPTYGVGLRRFLFSPNNVTTRALIRDAVTTAIKRDEPRVRLDAVDVFPDTAEPTLVRVRIRYLLADNPAPQNLVFPFYLDEGNA